MHYKHIALINNGVGDVEALRRRTRENCAAFGKEYREIEGGLGYFEKLVSGPYDGGDFVVMTDGAEVKTGVLLLAGKVFSAYRSLNLMPFISFRPHFHHPLTSPFKLFIDNGKIVNVR